MATSYELKVLAWLHTMLIEHDPQIGPGKRRIVVEEVRLEAGEPEESDSVVILFREVRRPQCLFGFLTLAREPSPSRALEWQRNVWDDPEGEGPQVDADMITARLREEVEAADIGLPMNCDPNRKNHQIVIHKSHGELDRTGFSNRVLPRGGHFVNQ